MLSPFFSHEDRKMHAPVTAKASTKISLRFIDCCDYLYIARFKSVCASFTAVSITVTEKA